MAAFVSDLLAILAGLLAIPVGIFLLEVVTAVIFARGQRQLPANRDERLSVAVLVPAHNESRGVLPTIADLKAQLRGGDRLLVVADNCTDDTAAVAAEAGAEVVVRTDLEKIGKGYALEWGIRHLGANPPDVVIVIDADCRVAPGSIDWLCATCARTGRPVQALDLMTAPEQSAINYRVAEFAWRVKNWVRPLGLAALGLPCQLMGTGMAFPWEVIRSAKLATGEVVEDLELGLDLASTGSPPIFCPMALVTSSFPTSAAAAQRQRQRWEHGHVRMIVARAPLLIVKAMTRRNLGALALALDLAVPPLTLLVLLTIGMVLLASLAAWMTGAFTGLIVATVSFVALATATLLAWAMVAQDTLPPRLMWSVVPYALRKLGLYGGFLFGRRVSKWIRTDRK